MHLVQFRDLHPSATVSFLFHPHSSINVLLTECALCPASFRVLRPKSFQALPPRNKNHPVGLTASSMLTPNSPPSCAAGLEDCKGMETLSALLTPQTEGWGQGGLWRKC